MLRARRAAPRPGPAGAPPVAGSTVSDRGPAPGRPAGRQPAGVFDVLAGALERDPDAEAVVTRQRRVTYAGLDALADRAAGALALLGVGPGDRVAAALPNDFDVLVAFHGAMRLGAVWVGVGRALTPTEKAHVITDTGAVVVVGDGFNIGHLEGRVDRGVRLVSQAGWHSALDASTGRPPVPAPDPGAPAAIAYTSGTAGRPRGAVHSQAALVLPGAAVVARRGWGPPLRKADSLPLTTLDTMVLGTLLTAQAGGTAVVVDGADAASIVDWIRRGRATVWSAPPALLRTLLEDPAVTPADLESLEEVWVTGAACPDRLRREFEERLGVRVSRTYGLTEAPAIVSLDDAGGESPPGSSGRPLDHLTVSSVEDEVLLSAATAGPWAGRWRPMIGYWNQPEATAAALEGAALRTGDLGGLDGSGYLHIVGRKDEMIVRGGTRVHPAQVERVLAEAPGVTACAVVGIPDEHLGERVGAVVETSPGGGADRAAVLDHCRDRLADHEVPERLVFVGQLPRDQMGRVRRAAVLGLLTET